MRPRSLEGLTCKPTAGRVSIALVGIDGRGSESLHKALLTLDRPRVIAYSRPHVFVANPPAGWIDLLALSHAGHGECVARVLAWARRRWPGALQAVVSQRGGETLESVARGQGAMVFLPPLSEDDWRGLLAGVKQLRAALIEQTAI